MHFNADKRCGAFSVELNKNFVADIIDYEEEKDGEYYAVNVVWDNEFEHYVGMLENELSYYMDSEINICDWICENYASIAEYNDLNWESEK